MKAIENAIGLLEEYSTVRDDGYVTAVISELKLLLPTPRRSRSQDDKYLSDTWKAYEKKHPELWK